MQKTKSEKTENFNKYSVLVTVCFFLVITYVTFFHHPYWIDGDYLFYSNLGNNILAGNDKNVNIVNAGPGGPVFYAFLDSVTGDAFLNAKLISLLCGTGIVFFSYYIIRNIFSAKIALLGQLFVVFSPRIDILSIQTLNEIIAIFLIFISFYHITKKQLRLSNIIITGTLLGIAFMFRYQSLIILLAIIVFLLIHNKNIRINLLYIATVTLFFTAAASPMFLYNYSTHGNLVDSNPNYEFLFKSKYKTSELIEEMKQKIAHNEPTAIFSDPNIFLKNYFYNLFHHNPDRLFYFTFISNLSTIPTIPFLGLIPVFGALIYLLKIKLDKTTIITLIGTSSITALLVLLLGDIKIHFFALFIIPMISLVILNFKKIDDNLKPILIAPAIYLALISIIPVSKPEHLLGIWIVFPALSTIFFIEVIPKMISKTRKTSQIKNKNHNFNINKIPIILLLLVFVLSVGHSYKSIENHLYQGTFSDIIDEVVEEFKQNEPRQPSGIELKEIGDFLATQPGIKDSYVMMQYQGVCNYYAKCKMIFAVFNEGKRNDTIENYITRKNWSDFDLYLSNSWSNPTNIMNTFELIPDYLVYTSPDLDTLMPSLQDSTQYEDLKILSDPTNTKIPKNFKFLYKSSESNLVVYKINKEN